MTSHLALPPMFLAKKLRSQETSREPPLVLSLSLSDTERKHNAGTPLLLRHMSPLPAASVTAGSFSPTGFFLFNF